MRSQDAMRLLMGTGQINVNRIESSQRTDAIKSNLEVADISGQCTQASMMKSKTTAAYQNGITPPNGLANACSTCVHGIGEAAQGRMQEDRNGQFDTGY